MSSSRSRFIQGVMALFLIPACSLLSQTKTDSLREGFLNPPESARPSSFWHWMNGNVTSEGVQLDLEWMKRIGMGGALMVDVDLGSPVIVDRRLEFMKPEWREAFHQAAAVSDRLGIELGISTAPGWSDMGGPWVRPEQAMKKLVWSETEVQGGNPFRGVLAQPPAVAGPFQDVPAGAMEVGAPAATQATSLYRDVAVLAYRRAAPERTENRATVTSNAGAVNAAALSDGDLSHVQTFAIDPKSPAVWLRFDYAQLQDVRAVSLALPAPRGFGAAPLPQASFEASVDGRSFTKVVEIPLGAGVQQTVSFPVVRARSFRVVLRPAEGGALPPMAPGAAALSFGAPATAYTVSELRLYADARINRFEDKAGFSIAPDYDAIPTPEAPQSDCVPSGEILDLTNLLHSDGTLDWTPPAGNWVVLRLGYSPTGHRNGPASPELTGLEVDKLNRGHVKDYLDYYLGLYQQAAGSELFGKHGVRAILNDSIESGAQNWTENLLAEFRQRRGYDAKRWLVALTGVIVDNASASDKFLWDFRQTISELLAENHYGQLAASAKERGLAVYGEALEDHRPQLGDDLEMRKHTTVPMGAMWTYPAGGAPRQTFIADDLGAASVAHLWGQNRAGAESMTSFGQPYAFAPSDLKPVVDLEFALGINKLIIHSSTHQPLTNRKPGLALAPFLGQYFNRNETWAEEAGPWVTYLSRNSFLLQQGRFVADVAYFYGEEAPLTGLYGDAAPENMPRGYAFDFVNADALRNLISVDHGSLVTPSGMSYRMLYLGGASSRLSVVTLRRLRELVVAGAVLVGNTPVASRSLQDDPAEFRRLTLELWPESATGVTGAALGEGKVFSGRTPAEVLEALRIPPDVEFQGASSQGSFGFVHRHLSDEEIYYIRNGSLSAETVNPLFRVTGKTPELWHADTGEVTSASYEIQGGRTRVPLQLAPQESVYVVFRGEAQTSAVTLPNPVEEVIQEVSGPWNLTFQTERGGPAHPVTTQLASWTTSNEDGIKYFSGTGTYRATINLAESSLRSGSRLFLDLGDVREIAKVKVNGRSAGTGWHLPYRFDVTGLLKPGENALEIEVTNLWVNRLIGDEQPGATRVAFTTGPTYRADAPLRPSGLLGPVRIVSVVGGSREIQ